MEHCSLRYLLIYPQLDLDVHMPSVTLMQATGEKYMQVQEGTQFLLET